MSMFVFKLLACVAVRARAGELAACGGEAAVTGPSCDGDTKQASSLFQTALQQQRRQRDAPPVPTDFCRPENGPHMRVRKNIFDMEVPQWRKFKEAFQSLYTKGLYTKYAVEHTMHYRDDPANGRFNDHGGAYGFLAFHRGQIQDLETELMQEADDCSIGFPFWDWSLDVETFKTSEIWSDEYMGDDEGCVESGLPGGWEYEAEGVDNPCVERRVRQSDGLYDSRRIAMVIMGTPDFEDFVQELEGIHNTVHGAIRGNMANKVGRASPSDPMFYLHHAFIDSIYFRWQQSHEDTSADLLRDELVPVIGRYSQGRDCVYLPIHRSLSHRRWATCVHYETTDNVHPPGSSLLQAFTADGECEALKKQIERNECSLEELENLKCVDTPECTLDEAKVFDLSAEFETDPEAERKDEKILHKLDKKTQCTKFASHYTAAEAHICFKCDVLCKGGGK